jgi:tRNA threonylcarbamoyladenosine biosynthesis protein TsaB
MLILAIDTALSACSVAIVRGDETLVSQVVPMARGQAEHLAPMVRAVAIEAGIGFSQIDLIAVTRGPGAFTGLRIGLAFARGLALALDRPCVGVSTLEVLALGAAHVRTLAAIDMAGSLFVGAWEGRREVLAPSRIDAKSAVASLSGEWAVIGSGAAAIMAERPDWHHIDAPLPDPIVLAHLAKARDPTTNPPKPLYLRGANAKLPGGVSLDEAN